MQKLLELFGINFLNENTQQKAKTVINDLILENGNPIDKVTQLMELIGADRLDMDTQKQLIEKICFAIKCERDNLDLPKDIKASDFKWNSNAESPDLLNETDAKKKHYRWKTTVMEGDPILIESNTEKMSKNQYRWGPENHTLGSNIL